MTVACVEGELHDFPARLVADTLDAHVRWLRGFLQREGVRDGQLEAWLEALAHCVPHDASLSPGLRSAAGSALGEARAAMAPELAYGVALS